MIVAAQRGQTADENTRTGIQVDPLVLVRREAIRILVGSADIVIFRYRDDGREARGEIAFKIIILVVAARSGELELIVQQLFGDLHIGTVFIGMDGMRAIIEEERPL